MLSTTLVVLLSLTSQSPSAEEVVSAVKAKSLPLKSVEADKGLEDMQALKSVLTNVRIVGMGEPTHGSREVFQMKHRMFEFLVKEMGYTVFALEASMPDCVAMDRYVMTGEGDVNLAVRAQGFWTWSTEEVADLIKWMRKYNQDPSHKTKLRVVGFDMQNRIGAVRFLKAELAKVNASTDLLPDAALQRVPRPALDIPKIQKAIEDALPKIKSASGAEQAELVKQIGVVLQQAYDVERGYAVQEHGQKVSPYFREALMKSETLLKSHPNLKGDALTGMQILEKSSKTVYEPAATEKGKFRDYSKAVKEYAAQADKDKQDLERASELLLYFALAYENEDVTGKNYRDMCMAKNMEWIVNTYLPGFKAMAWAHNMHVARWVQRPGYQWMGAYLNDSMKEAYYPVGFSFYEGGFQAMGMKGEGLKEWKVPAAPQNSLDAVLNQAGVKRFFLDFGKLDEKTKTWFIEPRPTRSIGAMYSEEQAAAFVMPVSPAKLFSGMIFIAQTTRARPLPR